MSKYIFKIIKNASLDKMKEAVNTVHERSGMSKRKIFNDMLHCTRKYGAGYYDYQIFAFYNLTEAQRATFMTRLISKKFNTFMNDYEYAHFLENKDEFNKLYKKYIGRDFIQFQEASKEEVREFCKKHPVMFCKMQDLECGHGCERIKTADYKSFDELYAYLKKQDFCILEENIEQHPAVQKLYPNAVNSMRFITVLDKQGEPHLLYIVQKMGLGGSIIDNNCLFAPVDPETGIIKYPAHSGDTLKGIIYMSRSRAIRSRSSARRSRWFSKRQKSRRKSATLAGTSPPRPRDLPSSRATPTVRMTSGSFRRIPPTASVFCRRSKSMCRSSLRARSSKSGKCFVR